MRNNLGRNILNVLPRFRPDAVYKGYAEHTVQRRVRDCQMKNTTLGRVCEDRCCFVGVAYMRGCIFADVAEANDCIAPRNPNTLANGHR